MDSIEKALKKLANSALELKSLEDHELYTCCDKARLNAFKECHYLFTKALAKQKQAAWEVIR